MNITVERDSGPFSLGRIRAISEKGVTLAMALKYRDHTQPVGERFIWHIAVVESPPGLPEPRMIHPRVDTADEAEIWVRYLAELVLRAQQAEAVTR